MKHYALHLTWRCVNECPYCWVRATVYQRPEMMRLQERPVEDWVRAIHRESQLTAELLGGEPFIRPWLYKLMTECPNTVFGLSTNGMLSTRVAEFVRQPRLANLVSVNVSYHPYAHEGYRDYEQRWRASIGAFKSAGYTACTNIVGYPGNLDRSKVAMVWANRIGVKCLMSPYERTAELGEKRKQGLICQGGDTHLLIAPDGSAWPCFTSFRSPYYEEYRLGNWLDGRVDAKRKPVPCHLDCVDYYVLPKEHPAGDMWGVGVMPYEEAEHGRETE